MNVVDTYRQTLDELTADRGGGPALAATLAAGRRRRRTRRSLLAAGVAATAVAATTSVSLLYHSRDGVAVDRGYADGASYTDFVPGTQIDEQLQATVGRHLPSLPAAADVYPSDWDTDGPIPEAQWPNATDWQAVYDLADGQRVTVAMGKALPGADDHVRCYSDKPHGNSGQPPCRIFVLTGGTVVVDSYVVESALSSTYVFTTTYTRHDASSVTVIDQVAATSWQAAVAEYRLDDARLRSLVTDDAMTFPDPVVTPPPPSRP